MSDNLAGPDKEPVNIGVSIFCLTGNEYFCAHPHCPILYPFLVHSSPRLDGSWSVHYTKRCLSGTSKKS